jgi:hypothetical protein
MRIELRPLRLQSKALTTEQTPHELSRVIWITRHLTKLIFKILYLQNE